MSISVERRILRRIQSLQKQIDDKQDRPIPNKEAFEKRAKSQRIKEIRRAIKGHPDEAILFLFLELINDTAD